jgi:hypothetical protein
MRLLIVLSMIAEMIQFALWKEIEHLRVTEDKEEKVEYMKEHTELIFAWVLSLIYIITIIAGAVQLYWQAVVLILLGAVMMAARQIGIRKNVLISIADMTVCVSILVHWLFNLR